MYRPPSFPPIPSSTQYSQTTTSQSPIGTEEPNKNEGRTTPTQLNPHSTGGGGGFPSQQPMRPMMPGPFPPQAPPRFPGGAPLAPRMPTPPPSNGRTHPPLPRPLQNQPFAPPPPAMFRPPGPPQGGYQPPVATGPRPIQTPYPNQTMHRPTSQGGQPSSPRIDPSQIPRPTESESDPVIHFETTANGSHQIPPLASSRYIGKEVLNCDPKFLRLTMNFVPTTSELCNNVALPLVGFIQPLALLKAEEESIKIVDFGESGPPRCGRCRAYINPFMKFEDGGRCFICPFCSAKNETPANYFCYLGPDGRRRDLYDRPELHLGTVEYAAPSAFMVRPPMPPVHFFLIDATFNSVAHGALHTICSSIKLILNSIQGQDRALVGIATLDSVIQFYHVKNQEGAPQILIVSDINEVFSPLPSLLMSLKDQKESIVEILDLIPKLYHEQKNGESCAGAAIEAAVEALKPIGGKLHVMLATRPSQGSRSLKLRDPHVSLSADKAEKEKQTVLLPQDNTYRTLALMASEHYICIDLFFFAHGYMDISTLSVLSTMTGGSVYKYDRFTVQKAAQEFLNDLRWNVSRPQGFEGVLRVRCSTGLEIESYLGAMNVRNQHEIELPGIDCDKSIMVKFLHDDKLQEGSQACFQCALLYSTTTGHRRIRVSTLAVPVTSEVTKVFRGADLESSLNYLARKTASMLPGSSLHAGKDLVNNGCANVLAAYRKFVSTTSASGQLILPDSLKLMPLYALAFMKSVALSTEVKPDERAAFLALLMSLPCSKILRLVYGRFFELDSALTQEPVSIPESLWLSSEKLKEGKVFVFENGHQLIIKIDNQVPKQTLKAFFGVEEIAPSSDEPDIVHSDHPLNIKLHKFLNELRMREGCYMSTKVAVKSRRQDSRFLNALIEDRNLTGPSYVQFLCNLHRMIQQKLS